MAYSWRHPQHENAYHARMGRVHVQKLKNILKQSLYGNRHTQPRALAETSLCWQKNFGVWREAGCLGSSQIYLSLPWELTASSSHCVQKNVNRVGDVQTIRRGMVTSKIMCHSEDAFVPQHHFKNPNLSVIRLVTHSCQKDRAQHILNEVQNTSSKKPFSVFLLKPKSKVQNCFCELHKRVVTAYNLVPFTAGLLGLIPLVPLIASLFSRTMKRAGTYCWIQTTSPSTWSCRISSRWWLPSSSQVFAPFLVSIGRLSCWKSMA